MNSMPRKGEESEEQWNLRRLGFIESDATDIDNNLLTLQANSSNMCYLRIYDEEEELIINGVYIRANTYYDYMRDVKNKTVDLLIEITKKILFIFFQHNNFLHLSEQTAGSGGSGGATTVPVQQVAVGAPGSLEGMILEEEQKQVLGGVSTS